MFMYVASKKLQKSQKKLSICSGKTLEKKTSSQNCDSIVVDISLVKPIYHRRSPKGQTRLPSGAAGGSSCEHRGGPMWDSPNVTIPKWSPCSWLVPVTVAGWSWHWVYRLPHLWKENDGNLVAKISWGRPATSNHCWDVRKPFFRDLQKQKHDTDTIKVRNKKKTKTCYIIYMNYVTPSNN